VSFTSGTRLGPYEIVAPLGAGGMGEVYRARDTRLDRFVALKLLPAAVATNPDRLSRFEREARAASALNHPAIVTIYDIGSAGEQSWISMELVDGQTLRDLLATGPLPLRRALTLAAQIADGLAKAHEAGIVHRDLKPENVMVTSDGFAKILDFGLARLTMRESEPEFETRTTGAGTRPGTVLGTLAYMSPEQASGAPVDFRSDQFSFGALLYEMLTGQRAFAKSSSVDTLSAVLRDDPPAIAELNPTVPPPVRWIVQRTVEKQAADRYASTRDLARDLANARDHLSEMSTASAAAELHPQAARSRVTTRERIAWAVAATMAIAAIALGIRSLALRPEPVPASVRFQLAPPENVSMPSTNRVPFEVSPDGRRVALLGVDRSGTTAIWVRLMDGLTWQRLSGTEGARDPFWSPDSREIGFLTEGKVLRVAVSGGDVQTIASSPALLDGTWSRDGVVLFVSGRGLYRVPASGGPPTPVLSDLTSGRVVRWPLFLPDSRHFVTLIIGGDDTGVYLGSLDSAEHTKLKPLGTNDLTSLGFTEPGYLLFVQGGVLMAQRLDVANRSLAGEVTRIAEGVEMNPPSAAFSVSPQGMLAYWAGSRMTSELVWVDRQGKALGGGAAVRGVFNNFSITADASRVAIDRLDTNPFSVWTVDLARGGATLRVTSDFPAFGPVWSPDATQLLYAEARDGPPNVWLTKLDRSSQAERLTQSNLVEFPSDWTRDGKFAVTVRHDPKTDNDVWVLPMTGDRTPRPIVDTPFSEFDARVSHDGRWLAYASNESGRYEVYVTPFPMSGERWKVSTNGGEQPTWRRDGRELFYREGTRLMAVSVTSGRDFAAGTPTMLFEGLRPGGAFSYAVALDGRFLISRVVERTDAPLTIVTDWRAGISR
jgi:eukaryotic-like serine/threonine-protein kinase